MEIFVSKKVEDWGTYVYPKVNAPKLLEKEIKKKKSLTKLFRVLKYERDRKANRN